MTKLKLFVWTGFCPDYGGGLAFAIAKTEKEARKLITNAYVSHVYQWGDLEIKDLSSPCGYCISGGC